MPDTPRTDAALLTIFADGQAAGSITPQDVRDLVVSKVNVDQLGVADGVATLGSDGKVPSGQLPASSATLAGLTDVDTTGVADGDVLTYDTGAGEWVPAAPTGGGGGGGGGIDGFDAHLPPASTPSGMVRYEFDGTDSITTGSFTVTNALSATIDIDTTMPGALVITAPAGSLTYRTWLTALGTTLSGDFTAVAAIDVIGAQTDYAFAGFAVANGAAAGSSKVFYTSLGRYASGTVLKTERLDSGGGVASVAGYGIIEPVGFIRLRRVGSTSYKAYSRTGRTWTEVSLGTTQLDFNPTHWGVHCLATSGFDLQAAIRWMAVVPGDGAYNGFGQ